MVGWHHCLDGHAFEQALVFIDECPIKFNYNFIYGMVSGDFRVEEKNRHSFVIPFAKSPKLDRKSVV